MLNRLRIPPWNKKHVTRIELKDSDDSINYLVMPSVYVPKELKEMIDKGDPYKKFGLYSCKGSIRELEKKKLALALLSTTDY